MEKTAYEKSFDVLKAFPEGLACFEFESLIGDECSKKSSAVLSLFVKEGLADKSGFKINPDTGHNVAIYAPNGMKFSERTRESRSPIRKRKRPTDQELIDLRTWKKDAIARFPELGTSRLVLQARARIAEIYRIDGNPTKAFMVERGDMDEGEAMRVALCILRGSN